MESWAGFAFLRQTKFSSTSPRFPRDVRWLLLQCPSPASFHTESGNSLDYINLPALIPDQIFYFPAASQQKKQIYNWIIVCNKVGKFMYIIYQFWYVCHTGHQCDMQVHLHINYNFFCCWEKDSMGIVLNEINML